MLFTLNGGEFPLPCVRFSNSWGVNSRAIPPYLPGASPHMGAIKRSAIGPGHKLITSLTAGHWAKTHLGDDSPMRLQEKNIQCGAWVIKCPH